MKFWNKSKEYRKTWTVIDGPAYYQREEAKRWCQQNSSKGRFYFGDVKIDDIGSLISWPWYFENSQDALAFKLIWR